MATGTAELELYSGEGVNLRPGADWAGFTKNLLEYRILSDADKQKAYFGLGVYLGQLITQRIGSTDYNIVHAIERRFASAIRPSLLYEDESSRALSKGVDMGRDIEQHTGNYT
jgi:hypothetical protein